MKEGDKRDIWDKRIQFNKDLKGGKSFMKKSVTIVLMAMLVLAMAVPVYADGTWSYDTETGRISGEYKGDGLVNTYITQVEGGEAVEADARLAGGSKLNVDVDFGTYEISAFENGKIAQTETIKADMLRVYGNDRYGTSIAAADTMKKKMGVSKFDTVVVACGTNFADALSGTYLAGQEKAPILLVNKDTEGSVIDYIKKNLKDGGKVYLLGGELVVSKNVETSLGSAYAVKRLAGTDRYGTNLAILQEFGVSGMEAPEVLACSGLSYADCLSVSSVGKPIMLVNEELNAAQKEFLGSVKSGKYVAIGGPVAVKEKVFDELKAYGSVERVGGQTRFDTSALVAKKYFPTADVAVLAYGMNFPDGLSGGPLGIVYGGPTLLVTNENYQAASEYAKEAGIKGVVVMGGTMLISDATARNCVA